MNFVFCWEDTAAISVYVVLSSSSGLREKPLGGRGRLHRFWRFWRRKSARILIVFCLKSGGGGGLRPPPPPSGGAMVVLPLPPPSLPLPKRKGKRVETGLDRSERIETCFDRFQQVWTDWNVFRQVQTCFNRSERITVCCLFFFAIITTQLKSIYFS